MEPARGCSVLGHSGHVNQYSPGVLCGNVAEERAAQAASTHLFGLGEPFTSTTTHRVSYQPYGKTGAELLQASQRQDKELSSEGQGPDLLTRHGRFDRPQETYYASLNELTYGKDRYHGEPRADTYLWSGSNIHNRTVPLNTAGAGLTATRKQQWEAENQRDCFQTTSRAGALSAALVAAALPAKHTNFRPVSDGAASTVGRKPAGLFNSECDKTYRRTGLRDIYYPGSLA